MERSLKANMRARLIQLEDYGISPSMGFIAEKRLERLPEYFSPWEKVCDDIPQMVKDETLRHAVHKLPLLDHSILASEEECLRAHLVLTCIAHSYVWCQGEKGAAKVLPKTISVPLFAVANHLDMPPVVNHYTQSNYNWRKTGPGESDIEIITTFTGTKSEQGFFKTLIEMELAFAKGGPQALIDAAKAVLDDEVNNLIDVLNVLKNIIHKLTSVFLKIHEVCDPKEFYCSLRPFLVGWGHNGSPLRDGLIYEGVDTNPLKYFGGSTSQSSVFHVLDAFLRIRHTPQNGEEHYLDKMRLYMPPKHRAFIKAIENGPSVKEYVLKKHNALLTETYNKCVSELHEFRNIHVRVVVRYIICQANKLPKSSDNKVVGTGGTDLLPFLRKIRSETEEAKI